MGASSGSVTSGFGEYEGVFKRCERINVTYFSLPMSVDQELDFRQHQVLANLIRTSKFSLGSCDRDVQSQHNHKIQTEYAKIRELLNILRGIRMQVVAALEADRIQDLPTEEDISVCGLVYDALGKAVAEVIRQRRELKEAVVEARVKLQDVVSEFGKGLDE
ncbi:hypothetical protein L596_001170 [Steinernema carpocapsae]|uniref:Uncharacterized protein n=1 Tax=Steinernema carpocapsae TaxID=34508 RepID=A0A4U8UMW5_STECR|nr:hypothetical protein L596_001170 [Steinernema carpocapsae]